MQIENCKLKNGLAERLLDFSVEIIKIVEKIRRSFAGRQVAGQLVRSSTSAGANYEEACGAESRSDFIHKMQIVLKELKESIFWLKLISKSSMISPEKADVLKREADELSNIITKSI